MEPNVKIYIPVKKPVKCEAEIKRGETAGYPLRKTDTKHKTT